MSRVGYNNDGYFNLRRKMQFLMSYYTLYVYFCVCVAFAKDRNP